VIENGTESGQEVQEGEDTDEVVAVTSLKGLLALMTSQVYLMQCDYCDLTELERRTEEAMAIL
jgi:hypothetical protein